MLHTFVTETDELALEHSKQPFKDYLRVSLNLLQRLNPEKDLNKLNNHEIETILEHAFNRYYNSSALFGSIETCKKTIDRIRAIGVTEIACLIDFGIDESIVIDNLRHLNNLRISVLPNQKNTKFSKNIYNYV